MAIEIQATGATSFVAITGSPFSIVCQVSTAAAVNTVISGAGATAAIAGDRTDFTVTLFDIGNNQRTGGGDQVDVKIEPTPTPGSGAISDVEVFDLLNGVYTVRYVIQSTATPYTISVTVNADSSNIKTSSLTVTSNVTSPAHSVFDWPTATWPAADPLKKVNMGAAYTFSTALKDAYANPIKEHTETLVTEITGQGQTHYSTAVLAALPSGSYSTTFTIPASSGNLVTDRTQSRCGSYTLYQYLVSPAGLSAAYYPNKWFSPQATPYLRQIDPVINFSWGAAEDIIPKIAREYVSIEWEGYLMPT
jgi:hypothetical protein